MTRRPVADVRVAVAKWLDGNPGDGRFMLWTAKREVNTLLNGGEYDPHDYATETQIARVMDEEVTRGRLLKLRRGGISPDGKQYRNRQPTFYTPAMWAAATAEAERDARQAQAVTAQWERIWDELDRRGYAPTMTKRGQSVRLSYASWNRLLGLDGD